jgi:hypothetical protein
MLGTGDITPTDGGLPPWGASRPAVLAFDVGGEMGWASLSEGFGFHCGTIDRGVKQLDEEWVRSVRSRVHWADSRSEGEQLVVVVEDVFFGKNVSVLAHLARYVGAVIALAAQLGVPSVRVRPHSWQSAVLGKVPRAQGKALSLARARILFGDAVTSEHESDAALLAYFARGALPRGLGRRAAGASMETTS